MRNPDLLLQPPIPRRPWRGVLEAKKPSQDCLQISIAKINRVYGSEDCLSLNVYTPQVLPVSAN